MLTNKKAIEMLEYIRHTGNGECSYHNDAQSIALDMAIEALKAEPCMVNYESDGYADGNPVFDIATCPKCGYAFEEGCIPWGAPFCPNCGQALKWEGEE